MRPGKNLITGVPPTKHKSHCNLCKDRFGLTSLPVFWNSVSHYNNFGMLSLSTYTVCPSGLTMYAGKKTHMYTVTYTYTCTYTCTCTYAYTYTFTYKYMCRICMYIYIVCVSIYIYEIQGFYLTCWLPQTSTTPSRPSLYGSGPLQSHSGTKAHAAMHWMQPSSRVVPDRLTRGPFSLCRFLGAWHGIIFFAAQRRKHRDLVTYHAIFLWQKDA